MTSVESALRQAVADLSALKARWALIGGLAVSARTIPRFTKDLDFAVAVADDGEAESVVHRLQPGQQVPAQHGLIVRDLWGSETRFGVSVGCQAAM